MNPLKVSWLSCKVSCFDQIYYYYYYLKGKKKNWSRGSTRLNIVAMLGCNINISPSARGIGEIDGHILY